MDQTNVERLFGASKRVFSSTCADCGAFYAQPVRQGPRPERCPACRLDRARSRAKQQHIERQAAKPKIRTFNCTACGGAFENARKRTFCVPCADAKERERWKLKNERRVAENAAKGNSWRDRTPEEREARKRASRQRERAIEKAKRRAMGVRPMAEVIAERKAEAAARRAERKAAVAAREAERRSKPWNAPGLSASEKFAIRYRTDPEFNLQQKLRLYERKARSGRYGEAMRVAIKSGGCSPKVEKDLGYTIEELKHHIERQFTKGMSWASFCSGAIHIDHIRPLASFDLTNEDERRRAWALSNLQPLWAADNMKKAAKISLLL